MRWTIRSFGPRVASPPTVMFLTHSFGRGGAERQLATLLLGLKSQGWAVSVACFCGGGPLQREVEDAGIVVHDIGKRGRWDVLPFLWRLGRLLRKKHPDIIHGYLPVPNMVALLLRCLYPRMKVIWGVRASDIDLTQYGWFARLIFFAERKTANFADCIIVNSQAGVNHHVAHGFPENKMQMIPNGVDTERFNYNAAGGARLRNEWRVPEAARLVGLVGRLDPMKGHATFLEAAAILVARDPSWHFVCVGSGLKDYTDRLKDKAHALNLDGNLVWVTANDEMAASYSALDLAVSSSAFGEGFSNVVAEAMACGRPCVVSNVGDSAAIVGNLGIVVPPRDPLALADAIGQLYARLGKEGGAFRAAVRERVEVQFGVSKLVRRTAVALQMVTTPLTAQAAK